ncbi:MAG: fatty acid hydroxylase [Capsulimonadaceae bacterium]
MNAHVLGWEVAAFVVYFLYGSYFEWVFHRYMLHSPKLCYRTFNAHTLVHHQTYKGDDTYHTHDEHPEKVAMDWWSVLAMVGFHLPFFWLIQKVTGIPSLWGGVGAIIVYYGLYESLHWVMHVPDASRWLSRFGWFRFIDDHHRVHHKYMLSNLNVILPLADLTLGTLRDRNGRRVRIFGRDAAAGANKAPRSVVNGRRKAA